MGSITDGVIEADRHPDRFRVGGVFRPRRGMCRTSPRRGAPEAPLSGASRAHPPGVVECIDFASTSRTRGGSRVGRRAARRAGARPRSRPSAPAPFSSVPARVICAISRSSTPIANDPGPGTPRSSVRASARGVASSTNAKNRSRARAALGVARRRARRASRGVNLHARALSLSLALEIWADSTPRRARSDPRDLSEPSPRRRGTRGRTPRAPSPLTRDRRRTHVR